MDRYHQTPTFCSMGRRMSAAWYDPLAFTGRWIRRGPVWRPIDYERPVDPPEAIETNPRTWGEPRLRKHHAAYVRGERDHRTIAGHREWERRYKARKRAEQRQEGAA